MKNIKGFISEKYALEKYEEVLPQIFYNGNEYAISISFEQEPEFEEGVDSKYISQYPLEDVLDKFFVYVSDFYPELNDGSSNVCYLEFSSGDIEDVKKLREIFGKHVYNKDVAQDGVVFSILVIE